MDYRFIPNWNGINSGDNMGNNSGMEYNNSSNGNNGTVGNNNSSNGNNSGDNSVNNNSSNSTENNNRDNIDSRNADRADSGWNRPWNLPWDRNNGGMGNMRPCERCYFAMVQGTIVELLPAASGNNQTDGCIIFATVEDDSGNTVTFMITPATFVVDWETLSVGNRCMFWYRTDAPMPLVYPPRYTAVVAARAKNGRMLDVSFYNAALVNAEQTLQLNLDGSVNLRTTNNQYFQGNPANHNLVVAYDSSTRSIPAQTTPKQVIVLCDDM